jgi:hypothetical protein
MQSPDTLVLPAAALLVLALMAWKTRQPLPDRA